ASRTKSHRSTEDYRDRQLIALRAAIAPASTTGRLAVQVLPSAAEAYLRRPGHVAAMPDAHHGRAAELDGGVLPAARLRLRTLFPGPARRVRRTCRYL